MTLRIGPNVGDDYVPDVSADAALSEVERLTVGRGEAAGVPPYGGCMFLAVTSSDDGFRFVSAWRSAENFHDVLESMLGPDLASVG
ncbi:MAG TPA: hypothetical protein VK875_11910 [Euzebyales bacterium]|nr:hypothetical protein [Euzebyales bacterium]